VSNESCPDRETLERFVLGQFPPEAVERLGHHVEQCARCVGTIQAMTARDSLLEAMRSRPTLSLDAASPMVESLMARLCDFSGSDVASTGADDQAELAEESYDFLAPPEAPGELGRLGSYRVLRVLGVGGMGVVFEAFDPQLERSIALKTMKPVLAASPSAGRRFLREARAAAGIGHDHIVPILHVGEERGVPFLAMPLLRGESLDARLKRDGKLPITEVYRIGLEIADGLAAAHNRKVIHRDIKPSNIWLDAPTDNSRVAAVRILDFGLARAVDDEVNLTQSGMIVGTPAYMAPEQAQGEAQDARCDLFSLGVVLYHMSTGELPFGGRTTMGILRALEIHRPKPPHSVNRAVPPALSALILRLIAKNPDDRPRSAGDVSAALRAIRDGRRTPWAMPRRRWGVIVGVLLAVFGTAATAYFAGREPAPKRSELDALPALFTAAAFYRAGLYPCGVAVGDFNGDGRPDLAVANSQRHQVNVLLGKDDGTFGDPVAVDAGQWSASFVATADLDRDGKLDLVVLDQGRYVRVLLGNGDGTFKPPAQYAVAAGPEVVAVGDLNGDGIPDLAVATGSGQVSILLGGGDGTFRDTLSIPVATTCSCMALADLNGDGKYDLAVGDPRSANIKILLGNGDGTFREAGTAEATPAIKQVIWGDFNGDGKLDLVTVSNDEPGRVCVLLGNGDGTFRPVIPCTAGAGSWSVTAGDFNGDGNLDLAVANVTSNTVTLLLGRGDGHFDAGPELSVGRGPCFLTAADFNGDGATDLVVANRNSNDVAILLARPKRDLASFGPADLFRPSKDPRAVATVDLNRDGIPDAVVANYGGNSVSVLLGRADGGYAGAVEYATGKQPAHLAVTDVNNDGIPDVIVANSGSDTVSVLLGRPDGRLGEATNYPTGKKPIAVAVADVDRDGKVDFAVADYDGGTLSLFRGRGDGTFTGPRKVDVGERPSFVIAADFDGDGRPDLAVSHFFQTGRVSVLRGKGDGTFRPPVTYPVGGGPKALAVADFNGDGKLDLVTANWASDDVNLLLGRGDGTFRDAVSFHCEKSPLSVVAGDFDGDGKPDLVTANNFTVTLLSGDGRGGFRRPAPFFAGMRPMGLAARRGRDGRLDLVAALAGADRLAVFKNRPAAPRLQILLSRDLLDQVSPDVSIAVAAQDATGRRDPTYAGSVRIHSTVPGLPPTYTFLPSDQGQRSFRVALRPGDSGTVEVEDAANAIAADRVALRRLSPAEVHIELLAPSTVTAGDRFELTVEVREPYGELIQYLAKIQFASTDANAVLPADYQLTPADNGYLVLPKAAVLPMPGRWTISVRDAAGLAVPGQATVTVTPRASSGP
jgi:hypothetical protein